MYIKVDIRDVNLIKMIEDLMERYGVDESDAILNILSGYHEYLNSK